MITDLTASMQTAISTNQNWVIAEASGELERGLQKVCQRLMLHVARRWTNDEAWALLKDADQRPVTCIWRRAPFAFMATEAPAQLRAFLESWQAKLIEVADWPTTLFSINLDAMEPYQPWFEWHTSLEIVSPASMTLLDLVYATH